MFGQSTDTQSRILDLSDGRVLFYAAGRAYYLNDRAHAQRLETQLKWMHNLSTLAIVATVLAAYWLGNWWLTVGALPAVFFLACADQFVVRGCPEVTDPAARAEVTARTLARDGDVAPAVLWRALIALGPLMPALLRGKTTKSAFQVLEIATVALAVTLGLVHLLRQRRARQQEEMIGGPRSVENTPIVPR